MYKKGILFFLILYAASGFSQLFQGIDEFRDKLAPVQPKTGILFNKGFILNESIEKFLQAKEGCKSELTTYSLVYKAIRNSYNNEENCKLRNFDYLADSVKQEYSQSNTVPLSVLFYEGDYIDAQQMEKLAEDRAAKTEIKTIFAASPMRKFASGSSVSFVLPENMLFSNIRSEIKQIEINTGNTDSYTKLDINEPITTTYDCIGEKSIKIRIHTADGIYLANSVLEIKRLDSDFYPSAESGFEQSTLKSGGLDNYGSFLGGTYRYNVGVDGVLDKPIIIVEGFDPTNSMTYNDLWSKWRSSLSGLLESGYDVILLNLTNNHASIQHNEVVVRRLIKAVNQYKVGNHEGVFIGESMGGVLGRVALKKLEEAGYDHQISTYISFDAPHKGASISKGIQTALEDIADIDVVDLLTPVIDIVMKIVNGDTPSLTQSRNALNSEACQQLLVQHHKGSAKFNDLQSYLRNIGYPSQTRNVALISGSDSGRKFDFEQDEEFIDLEKGVCAATKFKLDIDIPRLNTTSDNVSRVRIWVPGCIKTTDREGYQQTGNKIYENAPGGYESMQGASTNGISRMCFVPSVSAIDLNQSIINRADGLLFFNKNAKDSYGNYRNKDYLINNNYSPFDEIIAGSYNRYHVSVSGLGSTIIGGMIKREIMPEDQYLQNKTVSNNRDFSADHSITIGENVNPFNEKNVKKGKFIVKSGSTVNIKSASVRLKKGTILKSGSKVRITVDKSKLKQERSNNQFTSTPIIEGYSVAKAGSVYQPAVQEEKTSYNWTLFDENSDVSASSANKYEIPSGIKTGQYTLRCSKTTNGITTESTKVIWVNGNSVNKPMDHEQTVMNVDVFPNPTSGVITIDIQEENIPVLVKVIDLTGTVVNSYNFITSGKIDLTGKTGVYILNIKYLDQEISRQIICE